MDPASLIVGVFGVVCELYKVSMQTYDLYISIKDFSPDFKNLRLALNIERERLKLWAQCMGVDQRSGINERLRENPDLLELIRDILTNMTETFGHSAKMLEEYQHAQNPPPASEGDESTCRPYLPRLLTGK